MTVIEWFINPGVYMGAMLSLGVAAWYLTWRRFK